MGKESFRWRNQQVTEALRWERGCDVGGRAVWDGVERPRWGVIRDKGTKSQIL